jgi:peptidoglycan L-alanyl-D-glutamate endopeptidase CwlK
MSFRLSVRSHDRLRGVRPELVEVIEAAIGTSPLDFMVTEGLRSATRQAALVRAGASRTMKSRHLTGHAVDLAVVLNGRIRWDWPLYPRLAAHIKATAVARRVAIVWGGDWPRLRDGPHFELDRKVFP